MRGLRAPYARQGTNLDAVETSRLHAELLRRKGFLRRLYRDFYAEFARACENEGPGLCLELGSGGGFLKDLLPHVITSDLLPLPGVDRVFPAETMPFPDASVRRIFMLNTFHHFPDAGAVLREMRRVLAPGGRVVMIEPANTPWGRFVYRYFHHERFDPEGEWRFASSGPLSGANGALPWIVFVRDADRFRKECPDLRLRRVACHTPFLYLISGGFSYRQFLPGFLYPACRAFERLLSFLHPWLGMFMTIELERTP